MHWIAPTEMDVQTETLEKRLWDSADTATRVSVFTSSARILLIAWLTIHGIGVATIGRCLAVIAVWLVLMLAFEIAFGWLVFRASWRRIAADFDLRRCGLLALGMFILFLSPLLAAKWRGLL